MNTEITLPKNEAARRKRARIGELLSETIPPIACLLLGTAYVICALATGYDLIIGLEVVVSNAVLVALVATGATFIFTSGSFDLSLGSNMLVSALFAGLVGRATGILILIPIVAVGTAVVLSVTNSVLASFFNLPVFIMTVVMMNVYSSAATLIITSFGENAAVSVPMTLVSPLNNTLFRVILLTAFEAFSCFVFYLTKLGRRQKFLGGNRECAYLSGINAKGLTILSFALAGIGIGLASFSMIVETPTLSGSSGASVGMNMLIALVFGGMRMSGGPGSKMYSALIGSFSMAFLDSLMNIYVTGSWYLQIVKGIAFVAVVFLFSVAKRSELLAR